MKYFQKAIECVHDENNIKGFFGDYRWLSNFETCLVEFEGMVFQSSEAAYQAAKCSNKVDRLLFISISANESKKLARKIKVVDNWEDRKLFVMESVLISKFRNSYLRDKLINTGEKYLEETNWWGDGFWGVCRGTGHNHLGKILMKIRDSIKSEQKIH